MVELHQEGSATNFTTPSNYKKKKLKNGSFLLNFTLGIELAYSIILRSFFFSTMGVDIGGIVDLPLTDLEEEDTTGQ